MAKARGESLHSQKGRPQNSLLWDFGARAKLQIEKVALQIIAALYGNTAAKFNKFADFGRFDCNRAAKQRKFSDCEKEKARASRELFR